MAKQECTGSFESVKYSPEGKLLSGEHLLQQIINDKGEFSEQECRALLESEGAASWKQVQLRGVIGGTAAGKSTLLNQLEGTEFAVHDGERFVTSKTSGVWIGASPTSKGVIVLDFEGSNAFGLGNSTKDAQLMWLAISLCPVLMWCIAGPSADRVNSSLSQNISLLFQVYLRAPEEYNLGKRAIVFVVKSKESDTQFREFKEAFLAGIEKVFRSAEESAGREQGRLEDIMQIEVVGLKHEPRINEKNPSYEYKQDVARLENILNRLHNHQDIPSAYPLTPGQLFDISSFSKHLAQTWQAVTSFKLLQIDNHLELFASSLCRGLLTRAEEAFDTALRELRAGTTPYNPGDFREDITRLQEQAKDELNSGLDDYPKQLQLLEPELEQHILQQAREWRTDVVRGLKTNILERWHADFGDTYPPHPSQKRGRGADADRLVYTAFKGTRDSTMESAKAMLAFVFIKGMEESQEKDLLEISDSIDSAFRTKREDNVRRVKADLTQELLDGCDEAFERNAPRVRGPKGCRMPKAEFWESLQSAHKSMETKALQKLGAKLQIWGEEESARRQAAEELCDAASLHLSRRCRRELADDLPRIIDTLCSAEETKDVDLNGDIHFDVGVLRTRVYRIQGQCDQFQLDWSPEKRAKQVQPWLDRAAEESDRSRGWGALLRNWWSGRSQNLPSGPPGQDHRVIPSQTTAAWKSATKAIARVAQKKQEKVDRAVGKRYFWSRWSFRCRRAWRNAFPSADEKKDRVSRAAENLDKRYWETSG